MALLDARPELVARYDRRELREMLLSAVDEPGVPYVVAAARHVLDRLSAEPAPPVSPRTSAPRHHTPGGTGTAGSGGFSAGGFTAHGA
ncbi:hypothetical protein [Amycolatopsis methanolica]|uniref:hypothetical protein n=1 Tax=Amycolatopsis methanolica TaxID=1814 RepID=UPI00343B3168